MIVISGDVQEEARMRMMDMGALDFIEILDIDHFKKVNDTYGDQAGDEVIRNIASIIRKATRETELAGRYSSEEFVILLPDTPCENAITVVERIRKTIIGAIVKYEILEQKYTCSVGIADLQAAYTKPQMWIKAADKALYAAKEIGRNKVMIAPTTY